MTTTTIPIAAWLNNAQVKEPCSLCGVWFRVGELQFAADGVPGSVCDTCAAKHSPDLASAVEGLDRETRFAVDRHEYDFLHDAVMAILIPEGVDSSIGRRVPVTVEQLDAAAQLLAGGLTATTVDPTANPWDTDPWGIECKDCGKIKHADHVVDADRVSVLRYIHDDTQLEACDPTDVAIEALKQLTDRLRKLQRAPANPASREVTDYLRKPMVDRLQLDGWLNREPGDSVMVPDADGDVMMAGMQRERHRSGTSVRIWIDPAADPKDITRLLMKLADWYGSQGEQLLDQSDPW